MGMVIALLPRFQHLVRFWRSVGVAREMMVHEAPFVGVSFTEQQSLQIADLTVPRTVITTSLLMSAARKGAENYLLSKGYPNNFGL